MINVPVHSTNDWKGDLTTLCFLGNTLVTTYPGDYCILTTRMLASTMLGYSN